MIQQQSVMAHQYLDGLRGIEIGGSASNAFGLTTLNVDYCSDLDTVFKKEEVRLCGTALPVDVVARGDVLPFRDNSTDFVISSHVVEHFFDPIRALEEWHRVVRPGGFIFIIAPHKERTFDLEKPRTPLNELLARHTGEIASPDTDLHRHYSVWVTEDLLELCLHLDLVVVDLLDMDDKVANGFTIVLRKSGSLQSRPAQMVAPFSFAMAAALAQHQASNLAGAEKMYRQVLAVAPHHSDALHLVGLVLWQQGRAAEGMELVQRAIEINPTASNYHLNLAKMSYAQGLEQAALMGYRTAAALNPNSPDAHFNIGLIESYSGDPGRALASYERALALLRPDFAAAFSQRQASAGEPSPPNPEPKLANTLGISA